ncbi:DJ-1/PfpI family protein [Streptomyces sp. AV19]|uniref:DJ-1/PfpI family protein n=1 Tax=Streptomyces sp. AV19 TaxID=2793068 RepID=UPI0018FF0909|nr:DJ-1/PfpI family protein [Streptomyces sp. AV19]MBH1937642.1 DJ-1/PfpI family protein [Streptomyces sp. AV19]MDG4536311.1 DJ-1/PfpI family protein [Streptomyces sp. AV19]
MPKVLITTGDAGEVLEVLHPYWRLQEEGYEVHIAAPSRKRLQFVAHDGAAGFDTFTEKPAHTWPGDAAFGETDPGDYEGLVIPGGRAPEYLRLDEDFRRIVRHFFDRDKPVAHISHAAVALAPLGVLAGRRTTCWPACAPDVQAGAGTFVDEPVVLDGRMVSAQAWNAQAQWMRCFVGLLGDGVPAMA